MNFNDDDDSIFEQALRADLPSISEQNRLRPRILAAGVAVGTVLGSTNLAAATPVSFGASALSKLSALSWPAKLGLTALLAAPVAAIPLVSAPVRGAELVSQVRSSAATVRARAAAQALPGGPSPPLEQPQPVEREPPEDELRPAQAKVVASVSVAAPTPTPTPAASVASPTADGTSSASQPVSAAFDAAAHDVPASESQQLRSSSTLAAETQLLDRAFAALAAGERNTAAALVAEHARRFPNGLLRQERERARARLAPEPQGE